jgi:hypothetical protein
MIAEPAGAATELFPVDRAGLRYWCLLKARPGARTLLVILINTASRSAAGELTFFPLDQGDMIAAHVLWIYDPTLLLAPAMRVSAFFGTLERDPVEGVLAIARAAARRLALGEDDVVYWGHSGGGFAALMCAIRAGRGRAVALNPQVVTDAYRRFETAALAADVFIAGANVDRMCHVAPLRTSVIRALAAAREAGAAPRLALAQNRNDAFHYERQYAAFCEAFEIAPSGGTDPRGELLGLVYDGPAEHDEPPAALRSALTETASAFVLGGRAAPALLAC